MGRVQIATTDAEVAGLLEGEAFAVRLFESPAALAGDSAPGELAILAAPPLTPGAYAQLRARPISIPVIVIGDDVPALLEAGADAALPRPLDPRLLQAWVGALLRQRQGLLALTARQKELEELSRKDGLTGLFNHRWLKERLAEEFRRAQRHGDSLALLMIDLDEFKALNDRRGHPFGDRVLRAISDVIGHCVRETDLCARYGGEEFAVLLPRTGLNGALTVGERIRQGAKDLSLDGERVSLSLGISVGPSAQLRGPELLVRSADEALYRAKREGRNRVCIDPQTQLRGASA